MFYLPAIVLWLATILVGAALGWKALRFGTRRVFAAKRAEGVDAVSSVSG